MRARADAFTRVELLVFAVISILVTLSISGNSRVIALRNRTESAHEVVCKAL